MNRIFILLSLLLLSCGQSINKPSAEYSTTPKPKLEESVFPKVGKKIEGHFKADGKLYVATAVKTKSGDGNPAEDGVSDQYEIQFSGDIKSLSAGCCEIILINEGDLNNDGTEEFSIFQGPMNGCTYQLRTYSFRNNKWQEILQNPLIPTGCEDINYNELENRIFLENDIIYFLAADPNDTSGKLIKTKAVLK